MNDLRKQPTLETAREIARQIALVDYEKHCEEIDDPDPEWLAELIEQRISQALLAARQQQKEADAKFLDDQGHPLAAALLRGRK